jgi:hypothetical protein
MNTPSKRVEMAVVRAPGRGTMEATRRLAMRRLSLASPLTLCLLLAGCSSENASLPRGDSGGDSGSAGSAGSSGSAGGGDGGSGLVAGSSGASGSGGGGDGGSGGSAGSSAGAAGAGGSASGGASGSGSGGGAACEGKGIDTTTYDWTDDVPPSQSPPGGIAVADAPMFVTIGWDDNSYSGLPGSAGTGGMKWATDMIAARHHADGSPIHMTFYLTATYIGVWMSESPTYVKRSWRAALDAGHEVGNHTFSHSHGDAFTLAQWDDEIARCNAWLTKPFDAGEPDGSPSDANGIGAAASELYGFRTPFLEYNAQTFESVKAHGFWYDCSIEEGWQWEQSGGEYNWPYTLDGGSPGHDVLVDWGTKQAIGQYPGLWEMPVYPLVAPPDAEASQYGIQPGLRAKLKGIASWFDEESGKITGFDYNLWVSFQMTKAEFLATLKYSLDLRLAGNRAPFMLGAHTDYYSSKYTGAPASTAEERQQAIEEFVDYALSRPEVRIASVKQILDWMRDPKPRSCL